MRGLLICAALLATIAIVLTASAVAARSCGGHVTVTGTVACYKARSIVSEFKKTRKRHIQGFTCSGRKSGGRIVVVDCRLQEKRIHWKA